jgi:hypothetical protein
LGFHLGQKKRVFVFSVHPGFVIRFRINAPRSSQRARRSPLHCP